ncbi:MAG: DMT family transporter [Granulosicoccus sp.]|nr:DMT family transporter [Granulosicoccus sp.]
MHKTQIFDRHSKAILATTVLWGTFWIPLRELDALGQGSIFFTGTGMALPMVLFLPWLIHRLPRITAIGLPIWLLGFSFAAAGSLYAEGALRGNVARVILLFYLTPVWSTLLARWLLKEPITSRRLLTLLLGLTGMYVILRVESWLPVPQSVAEWFGLIAGICWGLAMVFTQRCKQVAVADLTAVIMLCYSVVFLSIALLPGGRAWTFDSSLLSGSAVLWILALAIIWNIPATALTLYGAVVIEPGKVAILLMLEVIIGVGTAAWLTDDPFGGREIAGGILIIAAGLTEFFPSNTSVKKTHGK